MLDPTYISQIFIYNTNCLPYGLIWILEHLVKQTKNFPIYTHDYPSDTKLL